MPIYEYKCEQGHLFEVMQKIADSPLDKCETCGSKARRIISKANLPRKAGVYVFDRERGNIDILHDPTLSDSEKAAALAPLMQQMQQGAQRQEDGG